METEHERAIIQIPEGPILEKKSFNFIAALIFQGFIILFLVTALTLALLACRRDSHWNNELSSGQSQKLLVIADDLTFYRTPTQRKPNYADQLFMRALKSSDLPRIVLTDPNLRQFSHREISLQIFFIVVLILLTLGVSVHLLTPVVFKAGYLDNLKKWVLIAYTVGILFLLIAISVYIRSQRMTNSNYIEIASMIRKKAMALTELTNQETISETLHSCQLRAIVLGQSSELQKRVEERRICDYAGFKLIVISLTAVAFCLMIIYVFKMACCQLDGESGQNNQFKVKGDISEMSLYVELTPNDFRKAGFKMDGDEDGDDESSVGSKEKRLKVTERTGSLMGSQGSSSSISSARSDTSFTFGNRKIMKKKFKAAKTYFATSK